MMWRSHLIISSSLIVSTFSFPLSVTASAEPDRICTRTPGSRVTLRKGAGTNFDKGLVMVGSGGAKVDAFFRQNDYTVSDGEQVTVSSSTRGTDGQTWKQVGTNQWTAWVRGDFVCGGTATTSPTLSAKDQAALKALGIPIAVPAPIPTGYTVSQVKVEPCPAGSPRSPQGTCRFGPQYGIVYRNAAKDSCFAIEAVGGGIGGPSFEYTTPVNTRLLGTVALHFGQPNDARKTPSTAQLNSPQPGLLSDWGSKDGGTSAPFYHLIGADLVRQSYLSERPGKPAATQCRNTITPNEAIKVMQSLTWLK